MKKTLKGTLAIDLGNTNTVVTFQEEREVDSLLLDIPFITSSPGVIPTAIWFDEKLNMIEIGMAAFRMREKFNSNIFFYSNFKRLICNSFESNPNNRISPGECGEKFFQILWKKIPKEFEIKRLVLTAPIETYKGYRQWLINLCDDLPVKEIIL